MACSVTKCGGCQYQNTNYKTELVKKKKEIEELFKGKSVNDCIGMDNPYNYRYKTITTFKSFNNRTVAGLYQEYSHNIVNNKDCNIQNLIANDIIERIKKITNDLKIRPYDEDKRLGCLRHVMIRTSYANNDAMVIVVTASEMFPARNEFVKALVSQCPNVKTIVQNINSRSTSIVLGNQLRTLYGDGFIYDYLCGYKFKISPKSFFQVNPKQTEILYNKAIELAALRESDVVLDTYSGIGTISLAVSPKVKEVIAVEVNNDAVKDSIENAKINKVKNVKFFLDDASKFMRKIAAERKSVDVVFMDPTRNGSDKVFLDSLLLVKPRTIVYISCGPKTQARDIEYITRKGDYVLKTIQPVDMFPRTAHVESVCLLELMYNI